MPAVKIIRVDDVSGNDERNSGIRGLANIATEASTDSTAADSIANSQGGDRRASFDSERFDSESRVDTWASAIEGRILNQLYDMPKSGAISLDVECRSATCRYVVTFPLVAGHNEFAELQKQYELHIERLLQSFDDELQSVRGSWVLEDFPESVRATTELYFRNGFAAEESETRLR